MAIDINIMPSSGLYSQGPSVFFTSYPPPADEASHIVTCKSTNVTYVEAANRGSCSSTFNPGVVSFFFLEALESVNQGMFFFLFLQWNCTTRGTPYSSQCLARVAGPGEDKWLGLGCCTYDLFSSLGARRRSRVWLYHRPLSISHQVPEGIG